MKLLRHSNIATKFIKFSEYAREFALCSRKDLRRVKLERTEKPSTPARSRGKRRRLYLLALFGPLVFATVYASLDDPGAVNFDTMKITEAHFTEDMVYDRTLTLTLDGGHSGDDSSSPSRSSLHSLTIKKGTIIAKGLTISS